MHGAIIIIIIMVETMMSRIERVVFWVERIITVILTCLWIQYHFLAFFFYVEESLLFYRFASLSVDVFFLSNTFFFLCFFFRTSLRLCPHSYPPQDEELGIKKKKWVSSKVERDAFYIERFGMMIMCYMLYLPQLTQAEFLHLSWAPCILLFPSANILHCFIFFSTSNQIDIDEIHRIQELENLLETAEQKYMKKLETVEKKWEQKFEEKQHRIWKGKRNGDDNDNDDDDDDGVAALSATEEWQMRLRGRQRKIEERMNDLRMKYYAAKASSKMYRNLLHHI